VTGDDRPTPRGAPGHRTDHDFDLVVLGTGSAAAAAAYKCRAAGWRVAVVDARPFGGTCALRGCDPKKVLVGAAELVDWSRRMQGKGIAAPPAAVDWPALIRYKREFTANVPPRRERAFQETGIATFHGRARFVGERTVRVGESQLTGRHVLVATGRQPARLGLPGEEYLTTSEQFLELDHLPRRIVFVGGGYISFEFAHVAARAGAQAVVLDRGVRPLKGFDPDLVDRLVRGTRALGVAVRLQHTVRAIERHGDQLLVRCGTSDAGGYTCEGDLVVHGAGRTPEIGDLRLEAAGVAYERCGVTVNDYLQSVSNPAVYAAGDSAASPGPPLTPVASLEGEVAAANMLEGNRHRPDYRGVPTVVYTTPPLAAVGLHEAEAQAQGLHFRVHHEDTTEWYSSWRVALPFSGFKTLIEEGTGRVLGAHIVGPQADEVINLFGLAIRYGLTAAQLLDMPWAYPTSGSDAWYMV
jgi:glutathione reductase (NADPH)